MSGGSTDREDHLVRQRELVEQGIKIAGSKRQLALAMGLSGQSSNINLFLRGERVIPKQRLKLLLKLIETEGDMMPASKVAKKGRTF